jgi:hypothetical protein
LYSLTNKEILKYDGGMIISSDDCEDCQGNNCLKSTGIEVGWMKNENNFSIMARPSKLLKILNQ